MPKKIAIIGAGTAGVFAASHFSHYCGDCEIELYFDPNIKPQPVGEGSTLTLPKMLFTNLGFSYSDLKEVDGTTKTGIHKKNWSEGKEFTHNFLPGNVGFHFNAGKIQKYIIKKLENKINIFEKNISHDNIDADYIMDCSGKPKNLDDFYSSDYIPVNSVHVTQCYWDAPRFNYTLTIARPYGWVFGIPLNNRCSIGYMYNNSINTLEEVKEDVKNIFKEYNLTPSQDTNSFSFNNYYRKNNFEERVVYSGNSSFFLEPLEATSIDTMDFIQRLAYDLWFNNGDINSINNYYKTFIEEIQTMIMLHYYSGSVFDTPFWDFAKKRGENCINLSLKNEKFLKFIEESKKGIVDITQKYENFGSWSLYSYKQNLENLNLYKRLL